MRRGKVSRVEGPQAAEGGLRLLRLVRCATPRVMNTHWLAGSLPHAVSAERLPPAHRVRTRMQALLRVAIALWSSSPSKPPTGYPTVSRWRTNRFKYSMPWPVRPQRTFKSTLRRCIHVRLAAFLGLSAKYRRPPRCTSSAHLPVTFRVLKYKSEQATPERR